MLEKRIKLNILMLGSGGCTLFSLLHEKIASVDVIDINQQQLYLIKLKLSIICFLRDKNKILDFFEGKLTKEQYDSIYDSVQEKLPSQYNLFWDSNRMLIYKGINNIGVNEKLFKELQESNFDFKKTFDRQNLIEKFGKKAVSNSKADFSEHFDTILKTYQANYKPEDNYFYHQMLFGVYNPTCLPPYFDNIENIIMCEEKMHFINIDLIKQPNLPTEKYDLIQISNITDWMNSSHMETFLQKVYKSLKKDGIIIARRMIGDYNLKSRIAEYFNIINTAPEDKSHFYTEVVVGKKV